MANPFPFKIKAGDNARISPHFLRSEFYSTSPAAGFGAVPEHVLFPQLVAAAEILRLHFNTPWRITSTFRNEAHERAILKRAGVPYFLSQHTKGRAFDSQPANNSPEILAAIQSDFFSGGDLYQKLRKAGITGFGVYDTFIHLDCRSDEFPAQRRDAFGLVSWWDSRSGKKKVLEWSVPDSNGSETADTFGESRPAYSGLAAAAVLLWILLG